MHHTGPFCVLITVVDRSGLLFRSWSLKLLLEVDVLYILFLYCRYFVFLSFFLSVITLVSFLLPPLRLNRSHYPLPPS